MTHSIVFVNRKSAILQGNKKYDGDTQCKKCGSYEKYVSSSSCAPCAIKQGLKKLNDKNLMAQYRTPEKKKNYIDRNPEVRNNILKKYRIKNRDQFRQDYKDNPEKYFHYSLKANYGIDADVYHSLLETQNFECAICNIGIEEVSRMFAVDHCHDSGKIRGLLCGQCNTGIGLFKENVKIFNKAISYIQSEGVL